MPELKIRKKRAKETNPRKPYNREEDKLRPLIINELRKKGCKVWRIENSISGKRNSFIPDLWVICQQTKWGGFIEIKTPQGTIQPGQQDFADLCFYCGVRHMFVRSLEQLKIIYG